MGPAAIIEIGEEREAEERRRSGRRRLALKTMGRSLQALSGAFGRG